jgi:hypothetical protein
MGLSLVLVQLEQLAEPVLVRRLTEPEVTAVSQVAES